MSDDPERERDKRILSYVGAALITVIVAGGAQIIDNKGGIRELLDSREQFRARFESGRADLRGAEQNIARLQEQVKVLQEQIRALK